MGIPPVPWERPVWNSGDGARALYLGDPAPKSDAWFGLRRAGITATDLPKILGLSGYGNARSVWHDKRGELPRDESGEAAVWGNLLEDVVAQEWARRFEQPVRRVGVLANLTEPWMIASCDRLELGRNAALEVKTRNQFVAGRWRDELPDDVLAQVAWQRRVVGFDFVDVACLIGGQSLVTHRYERDTELEDYLVASASAVWEGVQAKVPPPVEMDGVLLKLLEALYPDRSGVREVEHAEAVRLLLAYSQAAGLAETAKQAKEAVKAEIVSALGEAEVLALKGGADDAPLFTYRAQEKSSVNVKDLEDNDVELYESLLSGGHINTTKSRVLRSGKGAKTLDDE